MNRFTLLDSPIVDEINHLAASLYELHGGDAPRGFKFYGSLTPLAQWCWNLAVCVYYQNVVVSEPEPEDEIDFDDWQMSSNVNQQYISLALH